MMVDYATRVLQLKKTGMLRQKGALSSMHIPDKPPAHNAFKQRYNGKVRSEYICRLQRCERQILEEHVRSSGCKLIIDPYLSYGSKIARRSRIASLVEFLESISNDKVQIVIKKGLPIEEHITILGNWFVGKAVSATLGAGYSQTIFTRHAPTIQCAIEEFDQEMEELLTVQKIDPSISMEVALKQLRQIISELDEDIPKSASTNKKA